MSHQEYSQFENLPDFGRIENVVVFSGAGMSAESGIRTFRDQGGLWEEYSIYEVATPEAWQKNPARVQQFYNERRRQLLKTSPNAGHRALVDLEKQYRVKVVTQNIDDLHERAGSREVLHLHGELRKARSSVDEKLIYDIDGWEIKMGDRCAKGSQLRPHVVWFGEMVPMMDAALRVVQQADLLLVVGTSLEVYPAAGLVQAVQQGVPVILIDPAEVPYQGAAEFYPIRTTAAEGLKKLAAKMMGV